MLEEALVTFSKARKPSEISRRERNSSVVSQQSRKTSKNVVLPSTLIAINWTAESSGHVGDTTQAVWRHVMLNPFRL